MLKPHQDKIAILGTAPASMGLAPFRDDTFAIWACSPGTFPICAQNRSDAFFELHRWLPSEPGRSGAAGSRPWFSPEFHAFLQQHKGPVLMSQKEPSIPTSVRFPFEAMLQKYGPYFFCSTVAWMLALAIEQRPKAIALYGIDMAASEEWAYQRPSCQHFIGVAVGLGIEVILPPESDLMRPPFMYGLGELNPRHIKLRERMAEYDARLAQYQQQYAQLGNEILKLQGAKDALGYVMQSWCDDVAVNPMQAMSFAGEYVRSTGADVQPIKGDAVAG